LPKYYNPSIKYRETFSGEAMNVDPFFGVIRRKEKSGRSLLIFLCILTLVGIASYGLNNLFSVILYLRSIKPDKSQQRCGTFVPGLHVTIERVLLL
jgi:hypothetical protein